MVCEKVKSKIIFKERINKMNKNGDFFLKSVENLAIIIRPVIHKVRIIKGVLRLSDRIDLFHIIKSDLYGIIKIKERETDAKREVGAVSHSFLEPSIGRRSREEEASKIFSIC